MDLFTDLLGRLNLGWLAFQGPAYRATFILWAAHSKMQVKPFGDTFSGRIPQTEHHVRNMLFWRLPCTLREGGAAPKYRNGYRRNGHYFPQAVQRTAWRPAIRRQLGSSWLGSQVDRRGHGRKRVLEVASGPGRFCRSGSGPSGAGPSRSRGARRFANLA